MMIQTRINFLSDHIMFNSVNMYIIIEFILYSIMCFDEKPFAIEYGTYQSINYFYKHDMKFYYCFIVLMNENKYSFILTILNNYSDHYGKMFFMRHNFIYYLITHLVYKCMLVLFIFVFSDSIIIIFNVKLHQQWYIIIKCLQNNLHVSMLSNLTGYIMYIASILFIYLPILDKHVQNIQYFKPVDSLYDSCDVYCSVVKSQISINIDLQLVYANCFDYARYLILESFITPIKYV